MRRPALVTTAVVLSTTLFLGLVASPASAGPVGEIGRPPAALRIGLPTDPAPQVHRATIDVCHSTYLFCLNQCFASGGTPVGWSPADGYNDPYGLGMGICYHRPTPPTLPEDPSGLPLVLAGADDAVEAITARLTGLRRVTAATRPLLAVLDQLVSEAEDVARIATARLERIRSASAAPAPPAPQVVAETDPARLVPDPVPLVLPVVQEIRDLAVQRSTEVATTARALADSSAQVGEALAKVPTLALRCLAPGGTPRRC